MDSNNKVLTRAEHGFISGTLRGLADYYGLNLNGLQFVFLIAGFFGIGLLIYALLWVSLPSYSQREILLRNLNAKN